MFGNQQGIARPVGIQREGVQVGRVGRLDVHYADEKGERGRCIIK